MYYDGAELLEGHLPLLAQEMKDNAAAMLRRAMFKNINALPRSKYHAALFHGYGELCEGESGADVGGHVVRAFDGVAVEARIFGHEALEESVEVVDYVRVCIFLDGEGGGGVLHEHGEQSRAYLLGREPLGNLAGDFVESLSARGNLKPMGKLAQCWCAQAFMVTEGRGDAGTLPATRCNGEIA